MKPITRIIFARVFAGGIFWISIAIFYFQYRNLPNELIYSTLAFYAICVAILEYPTGVISDYFSQLFSLKIGYLLVGVAFVIASFQLSYLGYMVVQFIAAVGMAMTSGSDIAAISQYSENFEKALKTTKIYTQIVVVFSIIIGGFLFKLSPGLPVMLTGISSIISFLMIATLNDNFTRKEKKISGNVFNKAIEGINIVMKNSTLKLLVLLSAFITGFELSIKFVFNELFSKLSIPDYLNGVILGLLSLVIILGVYMFKSGGKKTISISLLLFPILLFVIASFKSIPIILTSLFVFYIARGMNDTYFDFKIVEKVPQENKASVLSFRSLISRGFSALYTFLAGFIIVRYSVFNLFFFTGIFFSLLILYYFFVSKKNLKKNSSTTTTL